MSKKKILLVANDTTYTYKLRRELISTLIQNNYYVVVAAKKLLFFGELEQLGCKVIPIDVERHGKNPFSDISLLTKYKKIISSEKPDAVISYNIKPNSYSGMVCNYLGVDHYPNITGLGVPLEKPGIIRPIAKQIYKIGISHSKCVFFQNESNYEFFKKNNLIDEHQKVAILPGSGVNLNSFKPLSYPKDGIVRFLFVSRILKEKGIDLYLDAAKYVRKEHPNTEFHICGYCDDKYYLGAIKKAVEEKIVFYHGEQKDMKPFYEMANCIVHPSFYPEGVSNVLLEAAASARPIITSDKPGCKDTVDNGSSGFVIQQNNQEALNDALLSFLELNYCEKAKMGEAGRRKMENEFDREIVIKKYLDELSD